MLQHSKFPAAHRLTEFAVRCQFVGGLPSVNDLLRGSIVSKSDRHLLVRIRKSETIPTLFGCAVLLIVLLSPARQLLASSIGVEIDIVLGGQFSMNLLYEVGIVLWLFFGGFLVRL